MCAKAGSLPCTPTCQQQLLLLLLLLLLTAAYGSFCLTSCEHAAQWC
jgi:hypothetical protein